MATDSRFIKVDGGFGRPTDLASAVSGGRSLDLASLMGSGTPASTGTSTGGVTIAGQTSSTPGTGLPQTGAPASSGATGGAPTPDTTGGPQTPTAPNPIDDFNLLLTGMLKTAQGVNTTDLLTKKRALERATLNGTTEMTPEELRTLSPEQQAAIRSGKTKPLSAEIDLNAADLERANQSVDNFFKVYGEAQKLGKDWADTMVAPDTVIENAKKIIEADPTRMSTVLAGFNDKSKQKIIQGLDYSKMGSSGTTPEGYNGEFGATIDQISNLESTVAGKAAVKNQLQSLIATGDYTSAYNQIANSVEGLLTGTPKQQFSSARTDYQVMQGLKNAVTAYSQAGGDMGLLTGTEEQIKRKLGIDSGKASALATQLWREFQTYRNTMTGAAFTPEESKDYAAVNPTLGKSLDLNMSVIDGALAQLSNRVDSTITSRVPSAKYIKEYADGAKAPATAAPLQDVMEKNGVKYQKQPDGSYKKVSFNTVGADTENRPQRNNNPGNIKAGGVADNYAAKDASGKPMTDDQGHLIFPDDNAGKAAIAADIKAKITGNSRFLQPNPTIAQLGSVYAQDPTWANKVAAILGVSPTTKTTAVDFNKLLNAIMTQEGYYA